MSLFPIFVKMAGRPALVVGGGALAIAKIEALIVAGAAVTVVSPAAQKNVSEWQQRGEIDLQQRVFERPDVDGKTIVYAATGVREVDRSVFAACREAGVWCNAIDDPEYCDFYSPAIVRRGDLLIAVSTNGQSPALAQQIRQELEMRFGTSWEGRLTELGRRRRDVLATVPSGVERTAMLHAQATEALNQHAENGGILRRAVAAVSNWLNTEDDRVALI